MDEEPLRTLLDAGRVGEAVRRVTAEAGETDGLATVVRAWGRLGAGDAPGAVEAARALLAAAEAAGAAEVVPHALLVLGVATVLADAPGPGIALLERAATLHAAPWPRAQCLRYLGLALEKQGAAEAAAARYLAAAALYAEVPHPFGAGSSLYGAAAAEVQQGRVEEARAHLDAAVAVLRGVPPGPGLGAALGLLATLRAEEDGALARALLDEAAALCAGEAAMFRMDVGARRAEVLLTLGRPEEALAAATAARALASPGTEAASLDNLVAEACLATGQDRRAAAVLDEAPPEALSGSVRLERHALRLVLAVRHGDEGAWEASLDAIERLARDRQRRRGAARIVRATVPALVAFHGESAARALQLSVALGGTVDEDAVEPLRAAGVRVPVGPIWLEERLGVGGMGEVWRAAHRDGTVVAAKLLRDDGDRDRAALFESEMQAVARLDHPHVVRVLAALRLDPVAAALLDRRPGTPVMVMEYASAGALDGQLVGWEWPEARRLLLRLLDALAHAHARGVLHLDLKPANVLMDVVEGERWPRLGDFGLAGLAGRDGGTRYGTPAYLAPEQAVEGAELDPRTDLYALGCLAWRLFTGRTPYLGDAEAQLSQHRQAPPPVFEPVMPVPAGLEPWLRALLARRPADRWANAADAAAGLLRVGGPLLPASDAPAPTPVPRAPGTPTVPLGPGPRVVSAVAPRRPRPPPAPFGAADLAEPPAPALPFLVGAGDGLFAWRVGRFVGREAERRALWETLGQVHADGQARCAWVRADRGVGRSALLRWLGETATARGAARVLSVRPGGGPGDRSREALAASARAAGLDRPVLVRVDDAEAADLAPLQRALADLPTLLVVASRAAPPVELDARVVELGPLSDAELGRVLDGLLPLDRALTTRLVARSAGAPGFAVALLGDLVAREALEPGAEGFRLRAGVPVELPADLLGLWQDRLGALAPVGSPRRASWELAAVLGPEHPRGWFASARARAGLAADPDVFGPLEAEGWFARAGAVQRFPVGEVREALLAAAEAGGRARAWHAAAADADGVPGDEALGRHLAAAGRHREALAPLRRAAADAVNTTRVLACGELLDLWDTCAHALGLPEDDPRRASPLVVRAHLALHTRADPYPLLARGLALARGRDPEAECQLTYTRAWILAREGRHPEAEAEYRRAIALAGEHPVVGAISRMGLAASRYATGADAAEEVGRARAALEAALPGQLFRLDAVAGRGRARRGEAAEARRLLTSARAEARRVGAAEVEADVLTDLAWLELEAGDPDGAVGLVAEAVAVLAPTGSDRALAVGVRHAAVLALAQRDEEARGVLAPLRRRYAQQLRPEARRELELVEAILDRGLRLPAGRGAAPVDPWLARLVGELRRRRAREGAAR